MFSSMSAEYRFQYGFQVMGMIERFLGFEILIPGLFWLGKFGKYFLYSLSQKYVFFVVFFLLYHLKLSGNFEGSEIQQGIFGGFCS